MHILRILRFLRTRNSLNNIFKFRIREVCWKTAVGEKDVKWNSEDDVKLIER
jgi:hypothetical protein